MMRLWLGIALLAGSWMLGLDYFYPAAGWAWFGAVACAVALLGKNEAAPFGRVALSPRLAGLTLVLLLPCAWFAAWPYRAAPVLIIAGLALQRLLPKKRGFDWLGRGATAAGTVMVAQSLALAFYAGWTMRSHELPWPFPEWLAGIATLFGIDSAADGSAVVMHSMRQVHRLAATWEIFFDPATFLFLVGGLAALALHFAAGRAGRPDDAEELRGTAEARHDAVPQGWRTLWGAAGVFVAVVLAWLPFRVGLLTAVYLHRVLRTEADRPLHAMNHFFSPWMLLLLLVPPALLAWRFVRFGSEANGATNGFAIDDAHEEETGFSGPRSGIWGRARRSLGVAACLSFVAVAALTAAVYWNPVGARKGGRVMVVERHSEWEPTTKPYDTTWFVEPEMFPDVNSGYNYARIYRYLGQYYEMSRLLEHETIDEKTLEKCDVLVIKTPTARYSPEEVKAVVRFVERGGGLLLVGDHTNYERSSTIMNDIARPMGFIFRDDLLFSFGASPYDQLYVAPRVPHPAVQRVPPMDFAVSCSIDPGFSRGRAVIANTGLWSMGPEYHYENFHPVAQHCPQMRAGAFIQSWAAWHGAGRVLAFTDSTIFSNFCVGQPGKSELMLGMVEWLNHGNPWVDPRRWLLALGLAALGAGWWIAAQARRQCWPVWMAAGFCGWVVGSVAVIGAHRCSMPEPMRKNPERCVVIDRTFSSVPLSKGAYPQGGDEGYGLLEQWIARLECHTVRKEGRGAFAGDVLVAICPSRSVPEWFREELEQYVFKGGRLLVIDSPENVASAANSLLWPFGLTVRHDRRWKGKVTSGVGLPLVEVEASCQVAGGEPVAKLGELPVAAEIRHGRGRVLAVGFGSLWNDARMGESWMVEPDATVRARYEVLFGLLRPLFEDKEFPRPPKEKEGPKGRDSMELPLKEAGPVEPS